MNKYYTSNRESILKIIDEKVIPLINEMDVDYEKMILEIIETTGAKEKLVRECLQIMINSKKIKHISILTIPDEKVDSYLKKLADDRKQTEKEIKEMEINLKDGRKKKPKKKSKK